MKGKRARATADLASSMYSLGVKHGREGAEARAKTTALEMIATALGDIADSLDSVIADRDGTREVRVNRPSDR